MWESTAGRCPRPPALFALLLLLLLVSPAVASASRRFWVSPAGSDSASGTKQDPFATLERARRAVRGSIRHLPGADVTVFLRGGVYQLSRPLVLTASDSPPDGHQVVFRAYRRERPLISGARRVPGAAWSRFDGKADIWRAHVGRVRSRELYVNGRRASLASTEDYPAGFLPSWNGGGPASGIEYLPSIKPNGFNSRRWGDPANWTNVRDIEAVILTQWKTMTVPLQSITPANGSSPGLLRMAEPAWTNANVFRDSNGQPGIWSFWQVTRFQNAYQFLDSPGEWYLDQRRGWLYYMPYPWQNLRTADVELPVLQTLVEGRGSPTRPVRNIEFHGLSFAYATWLQPGGDNGYVSDQAGFHLVGSHHQPNVIGHDPHDAATPGNVSFRYAHRVRFVDDRFSHLGAVGLELGTGSHQTLVKGSTFTDIGSSAVSLSGISRADHAPDGPAQESSDNTIAGNLISNVARGYPDAPGIFIGFASGTKVLRNTVQNVPWSGIALGWGWGLLDPGGFPGLPGANQYQWGNWPEPTPNRNSVVAGNTIRGFLGQLWDGGAIYTTGFQGTSPANALLIKNNTAYGKRSGAGGNTIYTDGGSRYIRVRGNTSYDNPIGALDFGPPPRDGDPLPYSKLPSDANGLPYGSDIGGCRTYGDISYARNSWFQAPMETEMQLANDLYEAISPGTPPPYSSQGFFDICPYTAAGTSYPTNLSFSGNSVYSPAYTPKAK
jgi:hypothetical protein